MMIAPLIGLVKYRKTPEISHKSGPRGCRSCRGVLGVECSTAFPCYFQLNAAVRKLADKLAG